MQAMVKIIEMHFDKQPVSAWYVTGGLGRIVAFLLQQLYTFSYPLFLNV